MAPTTLSTITRVIFVEFFAVSTGSGTTTGSSCLISSEGGGAEGLGGTTTVGGGGGGTGKGSIGATVEGISDTGGDGGDAAGLCGIDSVAGGPSNDVSGGAGAGTGDDGGDGGEIATGGVVTAPVVLLVLPPEVGVCCVGALYGFTQEGLSRNSCLHPGHPSKILPELEPSSPFPPVGTVMFKYAAPRSWKAPKLIEAWPKRSSPAAALGRTVGFEGSHPPGPPSHSHN